MRAEPNRVFELFPAALPSHGTLLMTPSCWNWFRESLLSRLPSSRDGGTRILNLEVESQLTPKAANYLRPRCWPGQLIAQAPASSPGDPASAVLAWGRDVHEDAIVEGATPASSLPQPLNDLQLRPQTSRGAVTSHPHSAGLKFLTHRTCGA